LIIVAQFNKLTAPLIIMTSVLFSTIGVFFGLLIFQMEFVVIMTMIGIISLAGVVVNNAIVLLDFVELKKKRKREELKTNLTINEVVEAIAEAGKTRLRPVLLTAITTVLGLIPLAIGVNLDFLKFFGNYDPDFYLGGDSVVFWSPLAWTIIFGLIFATFLTLIVVPVMYLLTEKFMFWLNRKTGIQLQLQN
jgi:multidrug efflux pump subunit AcrB